MDGLLGRRTIPENYAAVDPNVNTAALDAGLAACADAAARVPTHVIAVQLCGTRRHPRA